MTALGCRLCGAPVAGGELVVIENCKGSKTGYLACHDAVSFDCAKVAKFRYFCATKGVHLEDRVILDVCEECVRSAQANIN